MALVKAPPKPLRGFVEVIVRRRPEVEVTSAEHNPKDPPPVIRRPTK